MNIEIWAIGIAAVALFVSVLTLFLQSRADKRRLFVELSGRLSAPESQQRRRTIHNRVKPGLDFERLRRREPATYDLINGGLAELDLLGFLVAKGHLDYEPIAELWGRAIAAAVDTGTPFIDHRRVEAGKEVWPNLTALAKRLEASS
ncbi:hypothetical protein SAMN05428970_1495 [Agromyces sp. CF514]|uniref:DUF4760 domain-containing protein n=1 Tax=Agromyces sp. CF514 TaxID=1881031 RepID=UPI0008E388CA|nr:hypothetical protein [Agromyces sp. CF514]SFR73107.1 hypothetical protein SAMN05428970_1495 [Agromyces sp. CF514]